MESNSLTCHLHAPRDLETVVSEYAPLVRAIAWQVYASLPQSAPVEMGDVVQAGQVGLLDASRSYHPGVQVPFGSYARHRIRGEILDSLRRMDSASRGLRRWQRRMESETRTLTATLNREPSEEEVSDRMGIGLECLRKHRLTLWYSTSCSMPAATPGQPEENLRTIAACAEGIPDRLYRLRQMRQVLTRAVAKLPARSRKVVLLYYVRNLTMKQIGTTMGVQESRVSQLHKHALASLSRQLRSTGIRTVQDI